MIPLGCWEEESPGLSASSPSVSSKAMSPGGGVIAKGKEVEEKKSSKALSRVPQSQCCRETHQDLCALTSTGRYRVTMNSK